MSGRETAKTIVDPSGDEHLRAVVSPNGAVAVVVLDDADRLLLVAQYVIGFGSGAILMTIMTLAFSGLSRDEIPRAGAAFSVVQRVGAPFGVTVVAVLLEGAIGRAGAGSGALAGAFGSTFWWVVGFGVVPLVLALFLPRAPQPPAAVEPK